MLQMFHIFTDTCKSNSTGVNITKYPFSEVFADFSKINILKFYLKSTNMVSNVFAKTLLKPNQRKFYTSKISSYTLIKHSLSSHICNLYAKQKHLGCKKSARPI